MTTKRVSMNDLPGLSGTRLDAGRWLQVTQEQVDRFAAATGDHQWIHVDPERARRESPFGGTIAHGYLSLALVPALLFEMVSVDGATTVINYGANKVRFPAPLPVGSSVRLVVEVGSVEPVTGGAQVAFTAVLEVEGGAKPVMVAELLYRFLG